MSFDLQPPSWEEDDLNDATTNSSIEIEVVGNIMQGLDSGPIKFKNHPKPIYVWNGKNWEKTLM